MNFFANGSLNGRWGSKYGNRSLMVDGLKFDSIKESKRYVELKYRQIAGEIDTLTMQPEFVLVPEFVDCMGENHRKLSYFADFSYYDKKMEKTVVEDVKGFKTDVYKLKKKMFLYKYFGENKSDRKLFIEIE